MTFVHRPTTRKRAQPVAKLTLLPALSPAERLLADARQAVMRHTARPVAAQRQAVQVPLRAATLARQEVTRIQRERQMVQAQLGALPVGLERPLPPAVRPVPVKPVTPDEWVTVLRHRAEEVEGQRLDPRTFGAFQALQRQVAQRLAQGFRADRGDAQARYAAYGEQLATLQRHVLSAPVARVVLGLVPAAERLPLQRAADDARQRHLAQEQAALNADTRSSMQRQLADLDAEATQPVLARIQARRGAGNPLPEAIRLHLEQGLNHDLSRVRIHDDADADQLAKGVNALAFTTGMDIFFRAGQFNPNTRSGLELLAHEVTHTVQQSQGRVGQGIDPDAGLESEARAMGAKLAQVIPSPKTLMPPVAHRNGPHAPGVYTTAAALGRVQAGAAAHTLLSPLRALQRQPELTVQRSVLGAGLGALAGQIPGYTPLTMVLGFDPVAGKAVKADPNVLLDALGRFVPGPFKDMVKVVRDQNLLPKAWAWFQGELGTLQLGRVVTDLRAALAGVPNLGKAKAILTGATARVRQLVLGSARKLADIALTAITAGLGPVGKRLMGQLRQAGDIVTQVLKHPGQFAANLMTALRQGFLGFVGRSGQWIQQGLGDWLSGSANIQFPRNLNVEGVLMTALSIMNLGYDALRARLIKELGPGAAGKVALLEKAGGALGHLRGNVGKAPELKAVATQLSGEVLGGIKADVTETLVQKGLQRVALMFSPAGAAVGAILTAWNTIQTVIDKGQQIMGVIMTALGSVQEIAAGRVTGAARFIEQTIGQALPVMFSFAGRLLGIGNIGARLKKLVQGLRKKLGIDRVIDAVLARLKRLVGAGRQVAGRAADAVQRVVKGVFSRKMFKAGQENHSIWFDTRSGQPQLWVASTPREARVQLHYAHREAGINVERAGGSVVLNGVTHTKASIDLELTQGQAKIAAALNASSGGRFAALTRSEKVDAYFKQLSRTHFSGIQQHFKVLFAVADAHQVSRAKLKPATYYFTCKPNMNRAEYVRQVGFANAELKAMTVETFLKRRTQALVTNAQERVELGVQPSGRDYTEGSAMRLVRTTAKGRLEKLIGLTRDGTVQATERAELAQFTGLLTTSVKDLTTQRLELLRIPQNRQTPQDRAKVVSLGQVILKISTALDALDPTMTPVLSTRQVKRAAQEMIGSLALLHSLDQIGGGSGTVFPGSGLDAYGVARVNSSIGGTWPSMAHRIETHVRRDVSPGHYAQVSMSPISLAVQ
ncbi:eCIS core domain-containing protein [Deinococcus arenae]|uniref:eCIS core domain-containing protein n=1 Tax=Deinococcus arenae TaxID=1452751 RepID=UPI00166BDB2A|nr:DUF4157 domain-containing protein [Deinococcus arenae]